MNQGFKIYIPTKGRAGNVKTAKLLDDAGLEYFMVVEPQDEQEYRAKHPESKLIALPGNNEGIAFARNHIVTLAAIEHEADWIAMLDDDISGFGDVANSRCVKKDATILLRAFNTFKRFKKAVNSLNYDHLAWSASNPVSANRFCEVATFLYLPKITWMYRQQFDLKEDRDFCLQAIKSGGGTLRLNNLWFSCPSVGKNKGGLQEKYQEKRDEEAARRMAEEWAPYLNLVQKKDRLDLKADWNLIDRDFTQNGITHEND